MNTNLNWPPDPPSPCPDNNFGLSKEQSEGSDEARLNFLKLWDDWECAHPDDPVGTTYMQEYQARAMGGTQEIPTPVAQKLAPVQLSSYNLCGRPREISPDTKKVFIRIKIEVELYDRVKTFASIQGTSYSNIIRSALDAYLPKN